MSKTGSKSDGASPKPHYSQRYKDEIARQKEEIEQLRRELAAQPIVTTMEEARTAGSPVTPEPVTVEATTPVVDPLAWITEDTPAVFFVSSTSSFYLRPDNKRSNPPERAVVLQETSDPQPWAANPFDYRNEDRVMEQNNKVLTSKWHHLRLKPEIAEEYWEREKHGPWTETVIDPAGFVSWNKLRKRPEGEMAPIREFVPLRELTRIILQKNRMTYLNWSYHKDDFDPRFPNPYNNRLPGVGSVIKRELDAMVGKTLDSRRAGR